MKSFFIQPKERLIWLALLLALILLPIHLPLEKVQAAENDGGDSDKYLQLFMQVFGRVRSEYVDKEKTTVSNLIYGAIDGMLKSLDDPHTAFLDQKKYEDLTTETRGTFGGLGIYIRIRDDKLIIISPMEETPAWEVGLKPGDHIFEIEGKSTEGITIEEAVAKLRGLKGTAVNITVIREGEPDPMSFRIVRDQIKIKSVVYDVIKDSSVGYIKIRNFSATTHSDMKKALGELKAKNVNSMIIDLRNNPGGLLDGVCDVVDLFLDEGIIVYTKDRNGNIVREYKAGPGTSIQDYIPIVVLINAYSASASEIFAGAMQDHQRAVLLGEKTFGKFSVQNLFPIDYSDKTAFKMTIAYYYIPSGRSLHEEGINPDVEVSTEYFSPYEIKMITKVKANNYIKDYVAKHKDPAEDEKNIFKLHKTLEANEISLSASVVELLVSQERNRNKMPEKYDTKFDKQLIEAIKLLKSHKIFSRQK